MFFMSRLTTPRTSSRRDLLSILSAAVAWGTVGVTTQALYGLSNTNALSIGFFRLAFSFPLLLIICVWLFGRRMFQVKQRDLLIMVGIGALLALYQVCYFTAIAYCGIAVAALVTLCSAPVLVALFSVIVIRERMSLATVLALLCAISGTALLVFAHSTPKSFSSSLIGVLFALASACGYAGIILSGRLLADRYHPLHINLVAFGTGALLLLGLALSTKFVVSYPMQSWLLLLYLGSVPTALAYALFFVGIRTVPATITSIITLCEPLTSASLAWLFFGEQLGAIGLLGALLLLGAIVALTRKPSVVQE